MNGYEILASVSLLLNCSLLRLHSAYRENVLWKFISSHLTSQKKSAHESRIRGNWKRMLGRIECRKAQRKYIQRLKKKKTFHLRMERNVSKERRQTERKEKKKQHRSYLCAKKNSKQVSFWTKKKLNICNVCIGIERRRCDKNTCWIFHIFFAFGSDPLFADPATTTLEYAKTHTVSKFNEDEKMECNKTYESKRN